MTWTVADVMTKEVVTVGPNTDFKTCVDLMRIQAVSALPVVISNNRLVGILSEADLMRKLADTPDRAGPPVNGPFNALTASDLMTREVVTIHSHATVTAAARLMFERKVKRLPVVDAANRLIGIVSRADVLRVFLRSDEAIRKEIAHGLLNELPLLGRGRVQVDVRDGVVRLFGEVETGSLTGLLVRLVAAVPGVVGVENHLRPVAELAERETSRLGGGARA